jgi:hypothetical protein
MTADPRDPLATLTLMLMLHGRGRQGIFESAAAAYPYYTTRVACRMSHVRSVDMQSVYIDKSSS